MTLPYTTWRIHFLVQEGARQLWLLYFERDGRLCRINRVLLLLKVNPSEAVNCALEPYQVCLPPSDKQPSVKRFERSNGLDTALYKTIPLPLPLLTYVRPTNSESLYIHYTPTRFVII